MLYSKFGFREIFDGGGVGAWGEVAPELVPSHDERVEERVLEMVKSRSRDQEGEEGDMRDSMGEQEGKASLILGWLVASREIVYRKKPTSVCYAQSG